MEYYTAQLPRPFFRAMFARLAQWRNFSSCILLLLSLPTSTLFAQSVISALEDEINTLIQNTKPSVVTIVARKSGASNNGLFDIFSGREESQEVKVGTGLIISSDGFLLTKQSTIREAAQIEVILAETDTHTAELVAQDSTRGIALLKISAANLQAARFSMTDALHPGSWVTVIGNALGVPHAVSVGVVSAIQPDGLVQISANVDPGSNGSPAFDAHAHAVGMVMGRVGFEAEESETNKFFSNTAVVHPFADMLPFVRTAVEKYYAEHGWIGVTVVTDASAPGEPRILKLNENGPGLKGGLQVGDTITHFDGKPVTSPSALGALVNQVPPSKVVAIKVMRLGQALTFDIQVAAKNPIALEELKLMPVANHAALETSSPSKWRAVEQQQRLQQRLDEIEKQLKVMQQLYYKRN